MKRAIVVDSTIYLEENIRKEYEIFTIPLTINFPEKSYIEEGNLEELNTEIFTQIEKEKLIPKTSQPSPAIIEQYLDDIIDDGYEEIIIFTISSKLSGTYQGISNVAKSLETEKIKIKVIDTYFSGQASSLFLLEMLRIEKENGKSMSFDQLEDLAKYYRKNINVFIIVDNLNHFVYGGRVDKNVAAIANLVGIKPILTFKEGEIVEYKKVRSTKRAVKEITAIFDEQLKTSASNLYLCPTHVKNYRLANEIYEKLVVNCKEQIIYTNLLELGPVVSMHMGPGSVGIIWAEEYKMKK